MLSIFFSGGAIYVAEPAKGGIKPYNTCDVWRTSFKAVRDCLRCKICHWCVRQHLSASLPGRHCLKQRCFTVKYANAGRAVEFMRRKGVEIDIQRLNIRGAMNHSLSTIH